MLFEKDNTKELDIVSDNLANFAKAFVDFIEKVMKFFESRGDLFKTEE